MQQRLAIFIGLVMTVAWVTDAGAADDPPKALYSTAQAERGKTGYATYCASCHGATLGGGAAPALSGAFWSAWKARPAGELLALMASSMPADAPSSLDPQGYADILAYMLQTGGYPAGAADLPASPEALASTGIGAAAP